MVRPFEEEIPAAEMLPERTVEVPAVVERMLPPVTVRPFEEERPAVCTPPSKVEEAEPLPVTNRVPATESCWPGDVVPIPTRP